MNATSKLFFSSLLSGKNLFYLILIIIFTGLALAGIWLLVTGQSALIYPDPLVTAGISGVSVILAVLFALIVAYQPLSKIKRSMDEMELQNRHNQDAILRLLDEMGDLADGDLTVTATVTEDITGAIADSVNYTIDALRSLVAQINSTTLQVASAAQETQATALHLTDASEHQAQQISEVSSAITQMAASIELVSENASQSSEVAKHR
ncbi:methyl-accepting chemotaxis protein [Methylophaga muralis]|uniref:HAMP domain-containing protein n=1 Tax=Methylophaga muralis TaxID=291169 RepID=A0A1E3GVK2_9GAMM|nr:methyl-accepting chemotaxis protein [Methylophaga muralis]ODN68073.1 hypothetical protein A9E74_00045 [Methylophaga muralis]